MCWPSCVIRVQLSRCASFSAVRRGVCFYPFSQVTEGASRTTCPDKHANDMQMRAKKIDEKVMIGKVALQSIFCYHRFCVWRWLIDWRFWVKIFIKWNLGETFSFLYSVLNRDFFIIFFLIIRNRIINVNLVAAGLDEKSRWEWGNGFVIKVISNSLRE